ncbi:hypothetical protein ACKWTF_003671 [Chironomus riparius]
MMKIKVRFLILKIQSSVWFNLSFNSYDFEVDQLSGLLPLWVHRESSQATQLQFLFNENSFQIFKFLLQTIPQTPIQSDSMPTFMSAIFCAKNLLFLSQESKKRRI